MANKVMFPARPNLNPTIYAYCDNNPQYAGMLKVGYTTKNAVDRVAEQYPILKPGEKPYKIVIDEPAIREDGSVFTDKDVHRLLRNHGFIQLHDKDNKLTEWFKCSEADVMAAIVALRHGDSLEVQRTEDFGMRPEQQEAVDKTIAYFKAWAKENPGKTSHFLWNAKMRFGKTFTAYQLAKRMGWKKILIMTFKPAVQQAWETDLKTHKDFVGWQYIAKHDKAPGTFTEKVEKLDQDRPIVCFGSFMDYLGRNEAGGIKPQNEWVHKTEWDCVIFDEYHYGAWRENAKDLFENESKAEQKAANGEAIDYFDESNMPITTSHYLYLSGTPFRAINSGEFIEEQIYNWTYSDEQRAKEEWPDPETNPYAALPRMVMMTYQLPESIRNVALGGEFDEFDLNTFFEAEGEGKNAKFKYENEVQKWLDLIRGNLMETTVDNLKMGAKKPPMPFADTRLLGILSHTFWFLPSVAACYAMANLLKRRQNVFYHDYKIIIAAGTEAGIGEKALLPVFETMDNPLETKTITLSCGKLTTGVSVKPWSGIFMLRNLKTPETYFQAAFRVQTPWVIKNPDGEHPNATQIMKEECYIFDFAPDRALRQITDYSCRLNVEESDPEKKVAEFINFLPVLAYDGSAMRQVNAGEILDMAMSGTSATLLARRWESALLVNVDNATLMRLMSNEKAMKALMSIEGFRSLNQDIETIINKSNAIKEKKQKANERKLTEKEKKELSEEEKEFKSKRKQIQEKLIKFATRVPIFMYLTDYRERTLKDVITQLEPGLFKKVTGLDVKDFELLVSLGVFNDALMNDAVYKFKRYEDASLEYSGINKHEGEGIGLFDTVLSHEDYEMM